MFGSRTRLSAGCRRARRNAAGVFGALFGSAGENPDPQRGRALLSGDPGGQGILFYSISC
eukprot:3034021-Lingulodinium_polyedra.AAC.1